MSGRVAAIVNIKTASKNNQPTGVVGFFECVYNQQEATCVTRSDQVMIEERGMEAMDGTVNFGDRFK